MSNRLAPHPQGNAEDGETAQVNIHPLHRTLFTHQPFRPIYTVLNHRLTDRSDNGERYCPARIQPRSTPHHEAAGKNLSPPTSPPPDPTYPNNQTSYSFCKIDPAPPVSLSRPEQRYASAPCLSYRCRPCRKPVHAFCQPHHRVPPLRNLRFILTFIRGDHTLR